MGFSSQGPEHQSPVQVPGRVRVPHQGIFRVPNTSVRAVNPTSDPHGVKEPEPDEDGLTYHVNSGP